MTINNAFFSISDLGNSTLPPGATYTLISNTAASPIAGTFANLPDNSTLVLGTDTFQATYESGDGNDLTLTVVQQRKGENRIVGRPLLSQSTGRWPVAEGCQPSAFARLRLVQW